MNERTHGGETALHIASARGHVDAVSLLLKHKAGVDIRDPEGYTPLHAASLHGHIKVAKVLIECGADASNFSSDGLIPLHLAANREMLELLYRAKALLLTPDNEGGY